MDKKEIFLKELSELTKKYEIAIGGCGCCGSPYLYSINRITLEGQSENLYFYEKGGKYVVGDRKTIDEIEIDDIIFNR